MAEFGTDMGRRLKVSEQWKSMRKAVFELGSENMAMSCAGDSRQRAWTWRATSGGFQNSPVRADEGRA